MKVTVDKGKCIGSGGCVFASPDVFSQDDDGVVLLLQDSPPEELRDEVEEAVDGCPGGVIEIL